MQLHSVRVDLGVLAMKGLLHTPQVPQNWSPIRCNLVSYPVLLHFQFARRSQSQHIGQYRGDGTRLHETIDSACLLGVVLADDIVMA